MFCLQHQYNRNVTYNEDRIRDAAARLARVREFLAAADRLCASLQEADAALAAGDELCGDAEEVAARRSPAKWGAVEHTLSEVLHATEKRARDALANDFDTPGCVDAVMALVQECNKAMASGVRADIIQVACCGDAYAYRGTPDASHVRCCGCRCRPAPTSLCGRSRLWGSPLSAAAPNTSRAQPVLVMWMQWQGNCWPSEIKSGSRL